VFILGDRYPVPVSVDGSTIKCDTCGRERRMAKTSTAEIEELPDDVKRTYDKLGIPGEERRYLFGTATQAAASKLGWKSVDEGDYCPDCW
jgi:Fe-S cluster assembly scaffold protein SufB